MIRCTGVNVDLNAIPFQTELERVVGFALGSCDLIGQMAAPDYVDKLPILYSEFAEAAEHHAGAPPEDILFSGPEELMARTPVFWERYVRPKIERDFLGLYRFLNRPSTHGPNYYVERIQGNLDRVRARLGAQTEARPA
jgi:hypothetical protein